MSNTQARLAQFDSEPEAQGSADTAGQRLSSPAPPSPSSDSDSTDASDSGQPSPDQSPKLGFKHPPTPLDLPADVQKARQVDWVVYTDRYPHVFDAARLGYAIGHRENSSYQWTPSEVDLPVHFLDNAYTDPDLDRFVDRVFEYQPEIAVIGDITDAEDLDAHLRAAESIWESFPEMELIIVPKCADILTDIPQDFVLGYPNGKSDIQATDVASRETWRSLPHRLHILGGTPLQTFTEIHELTRPTLQQAKADIIGIDSNRYKQHAEQYGDYAAAEGGWHENLRSEYVPKRDLLRYSLLNGRHYWIAKGVWPYAYDRELPSRAELRKANRGYYTSTDSPDDRELFVSPSPSVDRHTDPNFRTDDTISEIIEPLSPLQHLIDSRGRWSPEGALNQSVTFSSPDPHHIEEVCAGCGANTLTEPARCAGYDADAEKLDIRVVTYEHQKQDRDHDYRSVAQEGPDTLSISRRWPVTHCYCSESCQNQTESRSPHLILDRTHDKRAVPEGTLLGKIRVTPF